MIMFVLYLLPLQVYLFLGYQRDILCPKALHNAASCCDVISFDSMKFNSTKFTDILQWAGHCLRHRRFHEHCGMDVGRRKSKRPGANGRVALCFRVFAVLRVCTRVLETPYHRSHKRMQSSTWLCIMLQSMREK
mmetsp:Transcript_19073/g.52971  ORF Transcript_19073/g.52971 Transcript_19073/m.52971 type:complete len:134 (+) Transcript_19073:149-550(+)